MVIPEAQSGLQAQLLGHARSGQAPSRDGDGSLITSAGLLRSTDNGVGRGRPHQVPACTK